MKTSAHHHEFWLGFAFGSIGVAVFLVCSSMGGWLCSAS